MKERKIEGIGKDRPKNTILKSDNTRMSYGLAFRTVKEKKEKERR
jgi:hypothetical protein